MDGLSRRRMPLASGAPGTFGTLGVASPARTRSRWTWAPSGSVAGEGAGLDPREPFWERAIATAWPKLVAFREKLIPLPLVPPLAWTIDEAARQYILFYLTKGRGTHIEIPDTNRPG
ncbi:hypothetical protein [Streptomyces prasinus]|uniref:hypothetical protein n=1 Tax=Streptomyces prasinus TaxID=67345 RepID=UPI0006EB9AFC|nr:hypothetical protein [Streptomyces prasinus]